MIYPMPYKNVEDRRESHRQYRIRNRIKLLEYFKTHPCVDCGLDNPVVLDFDHRNPSEKSFNVARSISGSHRSWKRILQEIDKCDVRCANCHRIKTAKQYEWYNNIPDMPDA